jgi:hypothetical protein
MIDDKTKATIAALRQCRAAILADLASVNKQLEAYRVKCPTCRWHILPDVACPCCEPWSGQFEQIYVDHT